MPSWNNLLMTFQPRNYRRRPPLILINGLAEQAESLYKNRRYWSRYFEVFMPNYLGYNGAYLHKRIEAKEPISVEFLVESLHTYLTSFVQQPPYHIVASSLCGKI